MKQIFYKYFDHFAKCLNLTNVKPEKLTIEILLKMALIDYKINNSKLKPIKKMLSFYFLNSNIKCQCLKKSCL